MITLSMIETLIRDNEREVNTDIALFQSIIEANEGSLEPESIYLYETAKEKLADLSRHQEEPIQYLLRDALSSLNHKRETRNFEKELYEMCDPGSEEQEDRKGLRKLYFIQDQDIALIEFLIDQFTKREVFLKSLEK